MSHALFSPCQRYRYALTRWVGGEGTVMFVMLNPSTADARVDDPTVRRCIGFAQRWGFRQLAVTNVYALRATDPRELWRADDPVGVDNDFWLGEYARRADLIVCAWGAHAKPQRVARVLELLEDRRAQPQCLGTTKAGAPKHPLYLRGDSTLVPYTRTGAAPA